MWKIQAFGVDVFAVNVFDYGWLDVLDPAMNVSKITFFKSPNFLIPKYVVQVFQLSG